MSEQNKIQLFENQPIRTAWNEEQEEWYFSVADVKIAIRKWKRTWGYLSSNSNLQIFSKMLLQKSIDSFVNSGEQRELLDRISSSDFVVSYSAIFSKNSRCFVWVQFLYPL